MAGSTSPDRREAPALAWTVPASWSNEGAAAGRLDSWRTPSGVRISLSLLPGDGGGLEANARRWLAQVQCTPGRAELANLLSRLERFPTAGGFAASVLDFSKLLGSGERPSVLGGVAVLPEGTLFLKASGTASSLAAEKARVSSFLASLRPAP